MKRIYIGLLLIILGGIILHAPISVGLGVIWPDYSLLIKSWKEILMLIAGVIAIYLIFKNKRVAILREPIILLIATYALLHIGLLFYSNQGLVASLAGLMIDLRYLLFFALVYIAMCLYPEYRKLFVRIGIAGALIVLIFALLQVLILPHDLLKYIGYGKETISPYLTVDQNSDYISINSTFRGPNPLGAYAGMVLVLIVAAYSKHKIKKEKWPIVITSILSVGGIVALWSSYSRSALIGTIVAIAIVLFVSNLHRISAKTWLIGGVLLLALGGVFWAVRDTQFISNVILHENPADTNNINSNEGHINSLTYGLDRLIHQPIGVGVGSTGSASLYGNNPVIIENQYLFTAHESGWIGLILFVSIFTIVMWRLWNNKRDYLALGVFASGISLMLIGLVLPVWVDDTVSIIWWGLAAIALSPSGEVI